MTKVALEYARYQSSAVMKKLAANAHGENYIEQTSSATWGEIRDRIRKMSLTSKSRVLDAGCGNGAFSLPLVENFPLHVEGFDLSKELIEQANAKAAIACLTSKCHFSVGDFTMLSEHPDAHFSLILCVGSLYWGQPLAHTLRQWHRITTVDGRLLLFLNLLYKPLNAEEKTAVGATQFIPALSIGEELAKAGWAVTEWSDGTKSYIEWLKRWCSAMEEMEEDIFDEMGKEAGLQLISRFTAYYNLAQRKAVRRIILEAHV